MEEGKVNKKYSIVFGILSILFVLYLLKSCVVGVIDTAGDVVDTVVPDFDLAEISRHKAFIPFCRIIGSILVTTAVGVAIELSDEFDDLSRLQKEGVKILVGIMALKGLHKEELDALCKEKIDNQAIGNVSVGGSSSLVTDVDEVRTYESGRVIIDTHNK